eukprot:22146-Chlamydomonas_euryale.AAC.1
MSATLLQALSDQISDGTLLRPGATLPVSALHGDWADASDQVMWKMYNHRYRDAAHMLYEVRGTAHTVYE